MRDRAYRRHQTCQISLLQRSHDAPAHVISAAKLTVGDDAVPRVRVEVAVDELLPKRETRVYIIPTAWIVMLAPND
jgi:hypothetical protein